MSSFLDYDYLLRVAIVGDSGVGKSALLNRIADNEFTGDYISTIGVDFAMKMLEIDNKKIKLQIWDTAGQERFHNITVSYYRSVDAIIVVYDVTENETFEHINKWYVEIKEYSRNDVQCMLIGNKCDKISNDAQNRKVSFDEAQDLADQLNMPFFETSAKDATNVNEAFNCLVKQTMDWKINKSKQNSEYGYGRHKPISVTEDTNKKLCCNII